MRTALPERSTSGSAAAPTTVRPHLGLADRLLEALAVLVPLAFNPFGVAAFEPFKITLIRVAALLLALTWVLHGSRRALHSGERCAAARPLRLAALAYLAATAVATAGSVLPLTSLLGSTERLQGLLTLAALGVIGAAASESRRPGRLVDALLLGSAPVCGYALLQQARLDPLIWRDRTFGPASTVGSSTELGTYLAMLVPLCLARAAAAARAIAPETQIDRPGANAHVRLELVRRQGMRLVHGRGRSGAEPHAWRYAGLVILAVLQAATLVLTGVRGALIGVVVGGAPLVLFTTGRRSRGRAVALPLVVGALGLAAVAGLATLTVPMGRLGEISPYLGRLAASGPEDLSGRERLLVWQASLETWAAGGPRLLLGFGPESQAVALEPRFPVALANRVGDLRFDRAHNVLVDQLLTTGLLGLAALFTLATAAAVVGRRALHTCSDRALGAALLASLAAGSVAALFAFFGATTLLLAALELGLLARLAAGDTHAELPPSGPRRRRVRFPAIALGLLLLIPIASPMAADGAYRRALGYHGAKNGAGELAWLTRAAALAPERDLHPLALGVSSANQVPAERSPARRAALLDAAESNLRRAAAMNPGDPYSHFHLAQALAVRAEAERRPELAFEAATENDLASRLSPNRALFLDTAADALRASGRYDEALSRYQQASVLTGPQAERSALIGDTLLDLGREDEAGASYRAALAQAPRSAAAHLGLSHLLRHRGDLPGALDEARLAARYDRRGWRGQEWLAQLEGEAGNRDAAVLAARAAARFAPPWEQPRLGARIESLKSGR